MAEYALTPFEHTVQHAHDDTITTFRDDVPSRENENYQAWLTAGNVPDSYVPPPPEPTPEDEVLYDHENRIRTLEGQPPLELGEFMKFKGGKK